MIKNAITYNTEMPLAAVKMEEFIKDEHKVTKPTAMELESFGFARHPVTSEFVSHFDGGYCLTFMQYRKKLDTNAVKCEADSIVKKYEAEHGRKATKKEKRDMKDAVIMNQLPHILPTPKLIFAYYNIKSKSLVIDTAEDKISDLCTSHLRKTFGSLKATTLYIDNRAGLTSRLSDYLSYEGTIAELPFIDTIYIGNFLELQGANSTKIVFKNLSLTDEGTSAEIVDNINDTNMFVKSLEMGNTNGDTFTLTDGFKFKGFDFNFETNFTHTEDEAAIDNWQADTFYAMTSIVDIADKVCKAFEVVESN